MEAFVAHENATNSFIKKLTEAQASAPAMKLLIRDQRRLSIVSLQINSPSFRININSPDCHADFCNDNKRHVTYSSRWPIFRRRHPT